MASGRRPDGLVSCALGDIASFREWLNRQPTCVPTLSRHAPIDCLFTAVFPMRIGKQRTRHLLGHDGITTNGVQALHTRFLFGQLKLAEMDQADLYALCKALRLRKHANSPVRQVRSLMKFLVCPRLPAAALQRSSPHRYDPYDDSESDVAVGSEPDEVDAAPVRDERPRSATDSGSDSVPRPRASSSHSVRPTRSTPRRRVGGSSRSSGDDDRRAKRHRSGSDSSGKDSDGDEARCLVTKTTDDAEERVRDAIASYLQRERYSDAITMRKIKQALAESFDAATLQRLRSFIKETALRLLREHAAT